MSCKNIFVSFWLVLFACLVISGCKIGSRDSQDNGGKKGIKGFFIFFLRANKKTSKAPVVWRMSSSGGKQQEALFGGGTIYSKGSFSTSEDGQKVAWSPPAAFSGIDVMKINGLDRKTILQADPLSNIEYFDPCFSPDGKKIAFAATEWKEPRVSVLQTYIGRINLDKSDLTTFTPNPLGAQLAGQPSYSPDGSEIAFTVKFSARSSQIVVIDSTSGELRRDLTPREFLDTEPVYSPDGENIVFTSNRGGEENIYIMETDGSNIKQLTFKKRNRNPSVSPNGRQIAFSSNRDGNWEIYTMTINGTKKKRLTKNRADDSYSEWGKTE